MRTVYTAFNPDVNPSLFAVPTLAELSDADKRGVDIALRLANKVDFEQYRELVQGFFNRYRALQQLKRQRLASEPEEMINLEFHEVEPPRLPPGWSGKFSNKGAPAMDPIMMLKLLVLQRLKGISDAAMAFEITDRASVQRFLELPPGAKISRQTIWNYKQIFAESGLMEIIALKHVANLQKDGLISSETDNPLLLDSSFVEAPKQRNTPEENKMIKEGATAEEIWPGDENKHKRRHKDVDASWTKKGDKTFYGFKMHALAESFNKFLIYVTTTTAKVHDSQVIGEVLSEGDAGRDLYADSAYCGAKQIEQTESFGVNAMFCTKGCRTKKITAKQKKENRKKSKIRSRIEHIFGYIQGTMKGSIVRTVGIVRANFTNWLTMFCYNIAREEIVLRKKQLE